MQYLLKIIDFFLFLQEFIEPMEKVLLFGILSVPILILSRRTLFSPASHGFYRFFSWECIRYFGDKYREYRKTSKMFVPYVF